MAARSSSAAVGPSNAAERGVDEARAVDEEDPGLALEAPLPHRRCELDLRRIEPQPHCGSHIKRGHAKKAKDQDVTQASGTAPGSDPGRPTTPYVAYSCAKPPNPLARPAVSRSQPTALAGWRRAISSPGTAKIGMEDEEVAAEPPVVRHRRVPTEHEQHCTRRSEQERDRPDNGREPRGAGPRPSPDAAQEHHRGARPVTAPAVNARRMLKVMPAASSTPTTSPKAFSQAADPIGKNGRLWPNVSARTTAAIASAAEPPAEPVSSAPIAPPAGAASSSGNEERRCADVIAVHRTDQQAHQRGRHEGRKEHPGERHAVERHRRERRVSDELVERPRRERADKGRQRKHPQHRPDRHDPHNVDRDEGEQRDAAGDGPGHHRRRDLAHRVTE